MIDLEWCDAAERSAHNAQEQFEIDRAELEKRIEFWRGYAACARDVRRHLEQETQG